MPCSLPPSPRSEACGSRSEDRSTTSCGSPRSSAATRRRSIASVAAARDADEIVVGGGRFGLARALHGSVAHDLLRLADVPVTVIPRGTAVEAA